MTTIHVKTTHGMETRLCPERSKLAEQMHFWNNAVLTNCDDKGGQFNEELYLKYLKTKYQNEKNSEGQEANSGFVGSTYSKGERRFTSAFLRYRNAGQ